MVQIKEVATEIRRVGDLRKRLCLESSGPCEWHKPAGGRGATKELEVERLNALPEEAWGSCPGGLPIRGEIDRADALYEQWIKEGDT
jgi:hypothetical protein